MNIAELLTHGDGTTHFSFEVLPPLKGTGTESLFRTIEKLCEFGPGAVSAAVPAPLPLPPPSSSAFNCP